MPNVNNDFNFGNWRSKKCTTQIIGDSYFVTITDITTRVRGMQVPMPVFAKPSYNDMCVFNNTDKIIQIKYNTVDGTDYRFDLPPGEFYNHHSDSFINNNSLNIRSLNGDVTFGQFDIYFNFGQIPTTTTQTSTTTTSTSSTSHTTHTTSSTTSTSSTTASQFPAQIETFNNWDFGATSQRILVYTPDGYDPSSSKVYPWALYLHSEGEYGTGIGPTGIEKLYRTGPTKYLSEGDKPSEFIIVAPQLANGSWTNSKIDLARVYATTNYKVDPTRLTLVGISIGGTGTGTYAMTYPDRLADYIVSTGNLNSWGAGDIPINGVRPIDVPGYFLSGVQDSVVSGLNGANYMDFANDQNPKPKYPFLNHLIWGGVHSRSVWDDNLYNRKYRTDAVGTAKFDWIEDIAKRYKTVDYIFNASAKVEIAETSLDLNKYLEALRLVTLLPASPSKVLLQSRLTLVATNIRNNHRNFILSFGPTPAINGPYNNIPVATGTSSPFVDIDNIASAYTFSPIVMNTTIAQAVGLKNDYLGFDSSFHETAFACTGVGNRWRLYNLKPTKLYNLRIYYADRSLSTANLGGGTISISGVTKHTEAQIYNTHRYIEFTNVNAINGYIELVLGALMTGQALDVTGLLLTELLNSNVVITSTTSTSTTTQPIGTFNFNLDFTNPPYDGNFEFYLNLTSI